MTIRDLLKKPFWTPKDLALVTGVSISTARSRLSLIRLELSEQGFINLNKSQAPVKIIIERLAIDLEFLEKTGALDIELDVTSYSKKRQVPKYIGQEQSVQIDGSLIFIEKDAKYVKLCDSYRFRDFYYGF